MSTLEEFLRSTSKKKPKELFWKCPTRPGRFVRPELPKIPSREWDEYLKEYDKWSGRTWPPKTAPNEPR